MSLLRWLWRARRERWLSRSTATRVLCVLARNAWRGHCDIGCSEDLPERASVAIAWPTWGVPDYVSCEIDVHDNEPEREGWIRRRGNHYQELLPWWSRWRREEDGKPSP